MVAINIMEMKCYDMLYLWLADDFIVRFTEVAVELIYLFSPFS